MKELRLSRGKVAIVDDLDYEVVSKWKWSYGSNGYAFRAESRPSRKMITLHRFLMDFPKNKDVDHINGNRLDNRRNNLRICSRKDNVTHRTVTLSKSGFIGVYWSKQNKKWNAQIGINRKSTSLGFFNDIQDAVRARQKAELEYFGEFAPSWRQ